MTVVMADVDSAALIQAAGGVNGKVKTVEVNVRERQDVVQLLGEAKAASSNGNIYFLFLNAGVMGTGISIMNSSREIDWRWVLDVNLFGVLHGIQVFLPEILAQSNPCLVAATASSQGLDIGGPPGSTSSYAVSKHAVIALMESLEGELGFRNKQDRVQVSVLCPGGVGSGIWDVDRQERTRGDGQPREHIASDARKQQLVDFFGRMRSPEDCVTTFFEGLARGDFICDSEPGFARETFRRRSEYVLGGLAPGAMRAKM